MKEANEEGEGDRDRDRDLRERVGERLSRECLRRSLLRERECLRRFLYFLECFLRERCRSGVCERERDRKLLGERERLLRFLDLP